MVQMKEKKKHFSPFRRLRGKEGKQPEEPVTCDVPDSVPEYIFPEMEQTISIFPEQPEKVEAGMSSIIGARQSQQDAADILMNESGALLAIVCDGMGGMEAGDRASKYCVSEVCRDFQAYTGEEYSRFLCSEIRRLDRDVSEFCGEDGGHVVTGTTFAAVIIENGKMYWGSVGDSRIYIIRGGEIAQITHDHNYGLVLNEKVEEGTMTILEAEQYPKKEALISFVGLGHIERIDVNENAFFLEKGDYILICSDGLYRSMDKNMILQTVMLYADDMSGAAEILTATAACIGGCRQDNTTVVIMKY